MKTAVRLLLASAAAALLLSHGATAQDSPLVAAMKDDLGLDGPAPGSRPLGKVKDVRPLIGKDGKVRAGFEAPK